MNHSRPTDVRTTGYSTDEALAIMQIKNAGLEVQHFFYASKSTTLSGFF